MPPKMGRGPPWESLGVSRTGKTAPDEASLMHRLQR